MLIQLATNENQLGPSPAVFQAVQLTLSLAHRYPEPKLTFAKALLGDFLQVPHDWIAVGNGSDHILELIIKVFLPSDKNAVLSEYAFNTIPRLISDYHATRYIIPANAYAHDIARMVEAIDANTRVLFLVNPNNPTGTYYPQAAFKWLLQQVPSHVLIVVDEAYYEYMTATDYPQTLRYLPTHPNLIIVRTFSKAYGLAGWRIGYAVAHAEIIAKLEKARLPYAVNQLATCIIEAALTDQDHIQRVLDFNLKGKLQIVHKLNYLGIQHLPIAANFISLQVSDAAYVHQALKADGILVKHLHDYGLPNHLRVAIGTTEQNAFFLNTLQRVATLTSLR